MAELKEFKKGNIGEIYYRDDGLKPVYLVSPESNNPYITSLAELIFWTDQFMEHAKFIALLTPMDDLRDYRERAVAMMTDLSRLNEEAKDVDLDEARIKEFKDRTWPRIEPLFNLEMEIRNKQKRGELHTLLWNSFLEHIAREHRRFMERQDMLINGEFSFDRDEVIDFWAQKAGPFAP